jgi:hypothetical protein
MYKTETFYQCDCGIYYKSFKNYYWEMLVYKGFRMMFRNDKQSCHIEIGNLNYCKPLFEILYQQLTKDNINLLLKKLKNYATFM